MRLKMFPKGCNSGTISYLERKRVQEGRKNPKDLRMSHKLGI